MLACFFRCNADPGIANGKDQLNVLRVERAPGLVRGRDLDLDFTALCELDRVAHEVHQHLTQSTRVAVQRVRHVRLYVTRELEPFSVRPHGQRSQRVPDGSTQRERSAIQR